MHIKLTPNKSIIKIPLRIVVIEVSNTSLYYFRT